MVGGGYTCHDYAPTYQINSRITAAFSHIDEQTHMNYEHGRNFEQRYGSPGVRIH